MLTYTIGDIDDEGFAAFCQFVNENHDSLCENGLVVYMESDGGCAKYLSPLVNLLNSLCVRVEIIRAFSTAFFITMMLRCPVSIGIDSDTMIHKAFTMLQYPAPKGDKGYAEQKRSLGAVQKFLDGIAELVLNKEQYKAYMKGKELFFSSSEFDTILKRARQAHLDGKFDKFFLYQEDIRPDDDECEDCKECEGKDDAKCKHHDTGRDN